MMIELEDRGTRTFITNPDNSMGSDDNILDAIPSSDAAAAAAASTTGVDWLPTAETTTTSMTASTALSASQKEEFELISTQQQQQQQQQQRYRKATYAELSDPTTTTTTTGSPHVVVVASGGTARKPVGKKPRRTRTLKEAVNDYIDNHSFTWVFLLVLGLLGGLLAYGLEVLIRYTIKARLWSLTFANNFYVEYAIWVGGVLFLVTCSMILTHILTPGEYGAGIPAVKAVLNRAAPPESLHWKTLLGRALSSPLSCGAGIYLGRLGVTVHMTAILARYLMKLPLFRKIDRNVHLKISMISASGAVGVGSNFGTPGAGVFFTVEVLGSYYNIKSYWKTFFVGTLSVMSCRALHSVLFKQKSIISLTKTLIPTDAWSLPEFFAFCIAGCIFGVLGAWFVAINEKLLDARARWGSINLLRIPKTHKHYRILSIFEAKFLWCIVVTLVCSFFTYPKLIGSFMSMGDYALWENLFSYDKLGEGNTAKDWTARPVMQQLALLFVIRYVITSLSASMPIPGGTMGPLMCIGAAGGRLIGEIMAHLFPQGFNGLPIIPGGYAMLGAACLTSSVTQSFTISFVLLEMCGRMFHLPTLCACVCAVWSSNQWSLASFKAIFYDSVIKLRNWRDVAAAAADEEQRYGNGTVDNVTVKDIMNTNVPYILPHYNEVQLRQLMDAHPTRQLFPVVDSEKNKYLIGMINRKALEAYICVLDIEKAEQSISSIAAAHRAKKPQQAQQAQSAAFVAADDDDKQDLLLSVKEVDNDIKGDENDDDDDDGRRRKLPFISAPFNLVEDTPLAQVQLLFSMFHVDTAFAAKEGRLVGEVTLGIIQSHLLKKKGGLVDDEAQRWGSGVAVEDIEDESNSNNLYAYTKYIQSSLEQHVVPTRFNRRDDYV